ncbi:MAG: hypothetical protein KJ739_01295 [Nitrospinae bacterium]|nr:hypothetical protein [Nitrospinota bacterium]
MYILYHKSLFPCPDETFQEDECSGICGASNKEGVPRINIALCTSDISMNINPMPESASRAGNLLLV